MTEPPPNGRPDDCPRADALFRDVIAAADAADAAIGRFPELAGLGLGVDSDPERPVRPAFRLPDVAALAAAHEALVAAVRRLAAEDPGTRAAVAAWVKVAWARRGLYPDTFYVPETNVFLAAVGSAAWTPTKSGSTTGFGQGTAPVTNRIHFARVPKYRRHKPTGQAVVTLGGRDHYLGRHGTAASREKYARLVAEWLERGRQVPAPAAEAAGVAAGPTTVNEVILAYLRHCLDYYKDSPAERDRVRLAMRPLRALYGRSAAAAFGPLALKAVMAEMAKTLARRTANQRAGVVKRLFRWAVGNELVPAGVYEALRAVEGLKRGRSAARETPPVRPVPDADVEATLPFVNPHVGGMVRFQRLTGARSGEVCIMRAADIDRTGPVWVYRPRQHKTAHRGRERVIFIGPKAQAVLAPFLATAGTTHVFSPARMTEERRVELRKNRRSKVTPSQVSRKKPGARRKPGERYGPRSYCHAVGKGCERAGVPHWHPHQLRHAAATELRREFGVEAARVVLGHRTAFTTEIYAEADRDKGAAAVAALG